MESLAADPQQTNGSTDGVPDLPGTSAMTRMDKDQSDPSLQPLPPPFPIPPPLPPTTAPSTGFVAPTTPPPPIDTSPKPTLSRTNPKAPAKRPRSHAPAARANASATDRDAAALKSPERLSSSDGSLAIDAQDSDPLAPEELSELAARSAPAWLVSMVFHTVLLIVLALVCVAQEIPTSISLNATYAETLGDQLEDDTFQSSSLDPAEKDPLVSLDDLIADDPLARPPDVTLHLDGFMPTDTVTAPSIGIALTGREKGMKQALLAKYGGTATTEESVARALQWLARNQQRDGSWSLKGPYSQGAFDENKTSATAMALLAFQGAGHTHDQGQYQNQVSRGWRYLLKLQDKEGNFYHGSEDGPRLYSQAQAMIALCEIYGMTKDSMFRDPAQKAVDYAVKIQAREGGWRYRPGQDSDTSVTGWFVMGLQSALMAGLDVPSPTLQRISGYLDTVAVDNGSLYKYHPLRSDPTLSMTAEGLLCREYLGWTQQDPRLAEGAQLLLENKVSWETANRDVYYWYYATQTLHHLGDPYWDAWNQVMRRVIPANQIADGPEKGSWPAEGDRWGSHGGRLYVTCLSTYMLEVYYRHLPIYTYRLQ